MAKMDALVLAGGVPKPGEPLYPYTQGASKALLDVCGKPMAQWVLDALQGADSILNVVIIGLDEGSQLACGKLRAYVSNQADLVQNVVVGSRKILELNPASEHILVVSSDIPAITPQMVDWEVETTMQTDDDLYYNVIERQVMEKRYPGSRRSYTRMRDLEVCGGDMNVIRSAIITRNTGIWEQLVASRKNVFKQAAVIGYDTLFLLLFRLISLDGAVKRVAQRLNMKGRAIISPYAEVGMDVDKPHQLELMRQDLAGRASSQPAA